MSDVIVTESYLEDIADAIRDRNGTNQTYKIHQMDEAIKDLHNGIIKKWVRPSDWPDYSQLDISNDEVIYLTYDTTYASNGNTIANYISITVTGAYTVQRGSLSNGVFTAADTATNVDSGGVFREQLPTNEGTYVVYKITPQSGASIQRFSFARRDNDNSSYYIRGWQQPCVERYCRLPNWVGTGNRTADQYVWSTRYLHSDTVIDASPTSLLNAYADGGFILTKVDMSTCSFSNVTNFSYFANGQQNLTEIYLPHDLSDKCTNIRTCFYNCYALLFVDFSGWDTSKVTTFESMFQGCRELIEIKGIEDFDVSSATTLANMFNGCQALRKLDTSKWETSTALTNLSGTFAGLYQVTELDVSGFNTTNVTSIGGCFNSVQKLKSIDLRNWTISDKMTSLTNLFAYCRRLKTIQRNLNWNTTNVTTLEGMFRECRCLKSINLSDFNTGKVTSARYMFAGCNSLSVLNLSNMDFTTVTGTNGVGDFASNCWLLSSITFPTKSIYMPSLGYCYSLRTVTIPSSVTTLRDSCLRNLEQCEVIDFRNHASVPTLNAATDITNGINSKLKIVVPDNLYSTWIAAANWNNATISSKIISVTDYEASLE